MTTPTFYLLLFGGGQLAWLWWQRGHFGVWVPAAASVTFVAVLAALGLRWHWSVNYGLLLACVVLMLIAPMVGAIAVRSHVGLTFEYDGLAKAEVAVDRLLHGQQIYGVSWTGTEVDGYGYIFGGLELRHFNHLPLTVLPGIPIRLLTGAAGLTFDYRMVLIPFVLVGMLAVTLLPISLERRFMVACAVFLNPAVATITVTGHDDVTFLVMGLLGLGLLSRRHPVLACLAFGCGAALKPFGALAIPLVLMVLWREWRRSSRLPYREMVSCGVGLVAPAVLTIAPFLLWNAGAFYRDIVLFSNGGIPDAYPISGDGLGGLLVGLGWLKPNDAFPFGLIQIAAVAPVLLLAWRTLPARPSLARFMGLYAGLFCAFGFTARFFAHNYVSALLAMACCILPLGSTLIATAVDHRVDPTGTQVNLAA